MDERQIRIIQTIVPLLNKDISTIIAEYDWSLKTLCKTVLQTHLYIIQQYSIFSPQTKLYDVIFSHEKKEAMQYGYNKEEFMNELRIQCKHYQ